MLNKISKTFLIVFMILLGLTAFSFAQNMDSMKMNHNNMQGMHTKNDSAGVMKMDSTRQAVNSEKNVAYSIVREGVIDLKSIDENKDGKVYQDVMDYNVISDKPGTCPLCGMILKEVTLKKAKEILVKSGFKVKE